MNKESMIAIISFIIGVLIISFYIGLQISITQLYFTRGMEAKAKKPFRKEIKR